MPEQLEREIERLEGRLERGASAATIDELAAVRRGLESGGKVEAFKLPNVKIGFACKQKWGDMVGDDRVRACAGCDRPVFNLSEMTRAEAEAVLATSGLTPCVRFYRRPDGTVMTTDCPTGELRGKRRLAVVASGIAAGMTMAAAPAYADKVLPPDAIDDDAATTQPAEEKPDGDSCEPKPKPETIDVPEQEMGVIEMPIEMGIMISEPRPQPRIEWSVWGRLGLGVATVDPREAPRSQTTRPPAMLPQDSISEAALAADLTLGLTRNGRVRVGAWGEVRTTTDPVAGVELALEGLPPHPYDSRIDGAGSTVLRVGGNAHTFTTAMGFGYTGSYPRLHPWVTWARHEIGARLVVSYNRSLDDPRDFSLTVGLELEPLGVAQWLYHALKVY